MRTVRDQEFAIKLSGIWEVQVAVEQGNYWHVENNGIGKNWLD